MKQHRKLHTCLLETLSHHRESQARINWDMNHTQILPLFYCCGSPQTTHWCMCTLNPEHWSEHTPSRTHSLSLSHANTHTLSLPHTHILSLSQTHTHTHAHARALTHNTSKQKPETTETNVASFAKQCHVRLILEQEWSV